MIINYLRKQQLHTYQYWKMYTKISDLQTQIKLVIQQSQTDMPMISGKDYCVSDSALADHAITNNSYLHTYLLTYLIEKEPS